MNEDNDQSDTPESQADERADLRALMVGFCAAIGIAVLFISGFTFDF
ncbi:MAG: hypothetical protein HN856_06860 [Gammaproteobacteria bacterium]|jgi:hypothetical protein|nr:hypothetical protein [Gammaproteobacteria bacterium]MCH1551777.1 hypothetical protein [Pseudomonadales bacterium]